MKSPPCGHCPRDRWGATAMDRQRYSWEEIWDTPILSTIFVPPQSLAAIPCASVEKVALAPSPHGINRGELAVWRKRDAGALGWTSVHAASITIFRPYPMARRTSCAPGFPAHSSFLHCLPSLVFCPRGRRRSCATIWEGAHLTRDQGGARSMGSCSSIKHFPSKPFLPLSLFMFLMSVYSFLIAWNSLFAIQCMRSVHTCCCPCSSC